MTTKIILKQIPGMSFRVMAVESDGTFHHELTVHGIANQWLINHTDGRPYKLCHNYKVLVSALQEGMQVAGETHRADVYIELDGVKVRDYVPQARYPPGPANSTSFNDTYKNSSFFHRKK